jgi:hypothetical protein
VDHRTHPSRSDRNRPKRGQARHPDPETRPHSEQGYRARVGILRLARRYGVDRLEAACDPVSTSALARTARSNQSSSAGSHRKASAQRFYGVAPGEDEGRFLAELHAVEPSNAKTLAAALDRQRGLRVSYDRIERNPDLLRPIVAAKDVAEDEGVAGVR